MHLRGNKPGAAGLVLAGALIAAFPAHGWAQAEEPQSAGSPQESAAPAPSGSASGLQLELPDTGDDGFLDSLNELLAPKEVLLDLTRLGSGDFQQDVFVIGGSTALAALAVDEADEFVVGTQPERLDDVSDTMSFLGTRLFLYPALASTFFVSKALDQPGVARTAAQMTQALLLTDILVAPLKVVAGRTRPDGSNTFSFPSGHTAGAFALATVLQHNHGAKVGIPAYAFASLMAASRVDEGVHFVSDVVVGAAIGYFAASTVNKRFAGKALHVHVVSGPAGGRGIGFTLEF